MKKVSSVVWQFFDRLEENKRCVAVLCKLCDSEYKYFGNTTNLRSHLIKKHPIQWEFRQNNLDTLDSPKTVEEVHTFVDDENTNHSASAPKQTRRRAAKTQNVDNSETENEPGDEDITHLNLVRQMHDDQGSDEEWLEEDYVQVERPVRHKRSYKKIKREIVTPPRRIHTVSKSSSPRQIVSMQDEYSVFGEYIANKLRKFRTPRTRGNIQQIITTILWQAEYGMYDDAEAVKRVLMLSYAQYQDEDQQMTTQENEQQAHEETIHTESG